MGSLAWVIAGAAPLGSRRVGENRGRSTTAAKVSAGGMTKGASSGRSGRGWIGPAASAPWSSGEAPSS